MALPPNPGEAVVKSVDEAKFVGHGGRWRKRPGTYLTYAESTTVVNTVTVNGIKHDDACTRLRAHIGFKLATDGRFGFTVEKNGHTWLNPTTTDFNEVVGNLTKGDGSWRNKDWKGIHAPFTDGLWITWPTDEWRAKSGIHGFARIDIQTGTSAWSLFQWELNYRNTAGVPARTCGMGWLNAKPNNITKFRLRTDGFFKTFGATVETS